MFVLQWTFPMRHRAHSDPPRPSPRIGPAAPPVCRDRSGAPSAGLRTLLMQEMIARGVLFQGIFVPCYSHSSEDAGEFVRAFDASLEVYARAQP